MPSRLSGRTSCLARGGKPRKLSLNGRIPLSAISDVAAAGRVRLWLHDAANILKVSKKVAATLEGPVFEVRQGYKSKDSKRQIGVRYDFTAPTQIPTPISRPSKKVLNTSRITAAWRVKSRSSPRLKSTRPSPRPCGLVVKIWRSIVCCRSTSTGTDPVTGRGAIMNRGAAQPVRRKTS